MPPEPVRAELPQDYGVPLLELLTVDPYYLFVSWEITSDQLEQARAVLGDAGFQHRQLELLLLDAGSSKLLARQTLYGEIGRWFIRHNLTGRVIAAKLEFTAGERHFVLNQAGPVSLPRDYIIEPERYDELHVRYGNGADGELVLEGRRHRRGKAWPDVSLPVPPITDLVDLAGGDASTAGGAFSPRPAGTEEEQGGEAT